MTESRNLYAVNVGRQDCSDGHSWEGVRSIYVLHYLEKGSGYVKADGKTHRVQKGQFFLVFPGTVTRYYPDKLDPYTYKWVDFTGEMAPGLLAATGFSPQTPVSPVLFAAEPLLDRLVQHCDPAHACNPGLLALLACLIESFPCKTVPTGGSTPLMLARNYLLTNLHKSELRVADAADYVGVSRSALFRIFRAETGLSPKAFILSCRMENARQMLCEGASVKATALSCGFADPLYFSAAFKRANGFSPAGYRKLPR